MSASRFLSSLLLAWAICSVTDSAWSQDDGRIRRLAVVVGVNEYRPNQGLDTLGQAVNDARRLSEALRNVGFTVIEMTHDVAKEPGKTILAPNADYIRDQLDAVIEAPNLGRDDAILISLHGHGVQYEFEETVTKNGKEETKKTPKFYFCPADAAVAGLTKANGITERNHLLPLDELYAKLETCSAATRLLIVDACRNDPSKPRGARDLASLTRPVLPPPPGGIAAFFSCKANQIALEDKDLQQGVFTHFLIQGLSGRADQPLEGAPADGIVTLSELTSYVSNNTYNHVLKKYPGAKQSPDMKGEFDTTLPLVHLPKEKPLSKEIMSPTTGMKLVLIPAGEFDMGSHQSKQELVTLFEKWGAEQSYFDDEFPRHRVKISRPFYLGAQEVTQAQYESVMGTNPSHFSKSGSGKANVSALDTSQFPVEQVSWYDALEFCNKLSLKEGRSAYYTLTNVERKDGSIRSATVSLASGGHPSPESSGYRLPTEAEWEYACRAGTTTVWHTGNSIASLDQAGWWGAYATPTGNSEKRTNQVGQKTPNPFGLFDMHGNVYEWCEDVYDAKLYGQRSGTTIDPRQTSGSEYRVLRGGSWFDEPHDTRSANRSGDTPDYRDDSVGFRLARTR